MKEYGRRSNRRIPAFGNWENANDLPITQYFESATQAGLIRRHNGNFSGECIDNDLYMVREISMEYPIKTSSARRRERKLRNTNVTVKEQRKLQQHHGTKNHVIVYNVTEPSLLLRKYHDSDLKPKLAPVVAVVRAPKPVDEDLYKISPELLRRSKRKKMLGFFPRCLLPPCVV